MNAFARLSVILFFINFVHAVDFVYEFGVDEGRFIYSKEGSIPLLKYETNIRVPELDNVSITYIKVIVDALAPPKVDYNAATKEVSIYYTWFQLTASTYSVLVKGMILDKQ